MFLSQKAAPWEVANGRYFVTIRLKGAIPEKGLARIRHLRQQVEQAIANGQDGLEERREVFREMEHWLDRAHTVDDLVKSGVPEMLQEAIEFRENTGIWDIFDYVIMPNHIHLFFRLCRRYKEAGPASTSKPHNRAGLSSQTGRERRNLEEVIAGFKRWTATQASKLLCIDGSRFWQREWFDHWSRSAQEDENIKRYIRNNPVKARLVSKCSDWPYAPTMDTT